MRIDDPLLTLGEIPLGLVDAGPSEPPPVLRAPTARVLHLINGEHYSGAERVQDLLALRLPELGYPVGLASVKPGLFGRMRRAKEAPLYELPMRTKLDFRVVRRLVRIVREGEYRIVHAHSPRTAMVGSLAAWIARVPLVYHVHSPASRDSTRRLGNWSNTVVERLSVRRAARLIAVSESLARHMEREGFDPRRIAVVPNGVPAVEDARKRRDANRPVYASQERGQATSACWTLGTVALFRPRKGTEVLLDALAILGREGLPVRLRAVGPFETPDYGAALRDRAAKLGVAESVEWTGLTRDVNAELARMDLFILPSLFGEGMPMVVLEAMAAGVPVVASRVEGIPEAIRDGRDGLLVAPGDPAELAGAIARVMRGEVDWRTLQASALARHAERFSDRAMAAGVAAVYRAII